MTTILGSEAAASWPAHHRHEPYTSGVETSADGEGAAMTEALEMVGHEHFVVSVCASVVADAVGMAEPSRWVPPSAWSAFETPYCGRYCTNHCDFVTKNACMRGTTSSRRGISD